MADLHPLPPLDTAPLFPALHAELMALLRTLDAADWGRPTVAGAWRVHDVVAHLLDGDLRKLSAHRDGHQLPPDQPIAGYADVVALIQRLNASGVSYGARLSPTLLTDLLGVTGRWVSEFVAGLDPDAPALYAVAWAGESQSDNRFDTAREYTERWHHQMQIRDAVGERGQTSLLLEDTYFGPLMETSLRALPFTYRALAAAEGTTIVLAIAAPSSRTWTLTRHAGAWHIARGTSASASVRVEAPADAWWRLFYNAITGEQFAQRATITGAAALITPLLTTRSVMV